MTPDDLDLRIERAEKNWQTAAQGDPGENTWVFYSYGNASAGIGGGYGVFAWLSDRSMSGARICQRLAGRSWRPNFAAPSCMS